MGRKKERRKEGWRLRGLLWHEEIGFSPWNKQTGLSYFQTRDYCRDGEPEALFCSKTHAQ